MNRGSLPVGELEDILYHASMRPRFMNRGSGKSGRWCKTVKTGFNEAPIHESGKCWSHQRRHSNADWLQ